MRCKWLICLEFSPRKSPALKRQASSLAGRSMPTPAIARKRRVPGTSRRASLHGRRVDVLRTTLRNTMCAAQVMNKRLHADPAEIKSLTGSPLMTTLVSLIYICLRRFTTFVNPAFGMNQPPALVQWAQAAALCAAPTRLTPARSIHAPTPRPRR